MQLRHTCACRPSIKRDDSGKPVITGYASVFYREGDPGTEYELYKGRNFCVCERIMPGCFDRALREGDDVHALFNHDPNQVLGRTRSGTLRLSVDAKGLRYEIDPPDTTAARDLMASLERGDVDGASFQFDYEEQSYTDKQNPDGSEETIIEVRSVKLYDVSPCTRGAYAAATSGLRSDGPEKEKLIQEILSRREQRGNNRPRQLKLFEAERDLGFYL